jgi:hypothetical protein
MTSITCTGDTLDQTIAILRAGGELSQERVVLWLTSASATREPIAIAEVYEPEQIADIDYFKLPPESLRALMMHLRARRLKIVAQVHSHPGAAFHSEADDKWAIVRQVGALSLVLPRFARQTTSKNFLNEVITYELSPKNEWLLVPNNGPTGRIGIIL